MSAAGVCHDQLTGQEQSHRYSHECECPICVIVGVVSGVLAVVVAFVGYVLACGLLPFVGWRAQGALVFCVAVVVFFLAVALIVCGLVRWKMWSLFGLPTRRQLRAQVRHGLYAAFGLDGDTSRWDVRLMQIVRDFTCGRVYVDVVMGGLTPLTANEERLEVIRSYTAAAQIEGDWVDEYQHRYRITLIYQPDGGEVL